MRGTRAPAASPVLGDPDADDALRRTGYAVVRLASIGGAAAMRDEFGAVHGWERHQLIDEQPPDFEIAMWDRDPEYQAAVASLVDRGIGARIEEVFTDHRPIARSIMVKYPAGEVPELWEGVPDAFHADATCVDERRGDRAFRIWMALQDVDDGNGAVQVVPYSHLLDRDLRGWGVEAGWLSYADVFRPRAVTVDLRAGEAIVFDPAVVHRSGPNRTDEPRVAVSVLLTRPDDPLCVFRRRDDATAEKVPITPAFFRDGSYNDLLDLDAVEVVPIERRDRSPEWIAATLDGLAADDQDQQRIDVPSTPGAENPP